jgi:hypothetical protein
MKIDNLAICMCMCVSLCCICKYNAATKSWLALGCSREPGCPWGHQIGDTPSLMRVSYYYHSGPSRQSNRWCTPLKHILDYFVMGEARPLVLPTVTCASNKIGDVDLQSTSWIILWHVVPRTGLRCILIRDALVRVSDDRDARSTHLRSSSIRVSFVSVSHIEWLASKCKGWY